MQVLRSTGQKPGKVSINGKEISLDHLMRLPLELQEGAIDTILCLTLWRKRCRLSERMEGYSRGLFSSDSPARSSNTVRAFDSGEFKFSGNTQVFFRTFTVCLISKESSSKASNFSPCCLTFFSFVLQ